MSSFAKYLLVAAICHVKFSHVVSLYPDDVTQDDGQQDLSEKINTLQQLLELEAAHEPLTSLLNRDHVTQHGEDLGVENDDQNLQPVDDDSYDYADQFIDSLDTEKRMQPSTFFGSRGKKRESVDFEKKLASGFFGARGKKMASGFFGARGKKMTSSGFFGARGKKMASSGFFGARGKKMGSSGFFGARGKKMASGFFGARGKKMASAGFFGARGKKFWNASPYELDKKMASSHFFGARGKRSSDIEDNMGHLLFENINQYGESPEK